MRDRNELEAMVPPVRFRMRVLMTPARGRVMVEREFGRPQITRRFEAVYDEGRPPPGSLVRKSVGSAGETDWWR